MTEVFRNGEDLHRITAAAISGKRPEDVTDEERRAAKPVNFGAVYGMGPNGLVATAWDEHGIVIGGAEAGEWLGAFAKAFSDFISWRRMHAVKCQMQGRIVIGKNAAKGVGRVYPLSRLPSGKERLHPRLQSSRAGCLRRRSMLALAAIDRLLFEHGDGGPVAWLHDEIILEVKTEDAERAAELLKRAMTEAFAETFPGAPLNKLVEARIGPNWATVKG
jgi:DNA polymerase I